MDAIWIKEVQMPRFEPLKGDIKTDVLIIGGGMAGLLCAWQFTRSGMDCVLVEADRLCGGITKNTTAKITVQHGLFCDTMLRRFGREKTGLYLAANQQALGEYRTLCSKLHCHFETQDSYVYMLKERQTLERETAALKSLGVDAQFTEELPLSLPAVGAVCIRGQAQFHPLQFAAAIAEGLPVFEETKVLELAPGRAITKHGTIFAKKIVIATHFPILNKHGGYFLKLYQHRSYVLALENVPPMSGMYVDAAKTGLSFRSYGDLLLLGGGGHRSGKKGGCWQELETFAAKTYPKAHIRARWSTQDCMTLDGIPYIGQYAGNTPDLYVITGFNKWGMTSAMAGAMLLKDLIQGRPTPYAEVFAPNRGSMRPQLAANILEATCSLLTPAAPRCPHMGCALHYNAAERSWDCPCHGSRFAEDGTLLDNPATDDKKMRK